MKILTIPRHLASALILIAFAPIAGMLHVLMADPRPWWRIPLMDLSIGALWVAGVVFPLGCAFLRGSLNTRAALAPLGALWVVSVFVQSILQRNVGLAFFGVGLLIYVLAAIHWLWNESNRSYFNPMLPWYEGTPRPIHALTCFLVVRTEGPGQEAAEQKISALPSRIDEDGAYLFADLDLGKWSKVRAVEFDWGGLHLLVPAKSTTVVIREQVHGFGLRFAGVSPDTQKELGDLLERLRVHGYAT